MNADWTLPPENLALADGVHVWRASLERRHLAALSALLSDDERERAARVRDEADRNKYIAGRGVLRRLLASYLGMEPEEIEFSYADQKPLLEPENALRFSVAHSGSTALIAVMYDAAIGVDLETVVDAPDLPALARRHFTDAENSALATLPEADRTRAFFACWTRKEALVKAREDKSLDFDVSVTPDEPARLLATRFETDEASRWTLQALTPGPGLVAAVAVEGPLRDLHCWQWPPG